MLFGIGIRTTFLCFWFQKAFLSEGEVIVYEGFIVYRTRLRKSFKSAKVLFSRNHKETIHLEI